MSAHFSFEVVNALDYDELRPDYAPHAVAWVAERAGLVPASLVVDLAAGTGQLSRRARRSLMWGRATASSRSERWSGLARVDT